MPQLYLSADLLEADVVHEDDRLESTSERHKLRLAPAAPMPIASIETLLAAHPGHGLVIELRQGWPGRVHLTLAGRALRDGRRVWFYWPAEEALEVADRHRLREYWRLWAIVQAYERPRRFVRRLARKFYRGSVLATSVPGQDVAEPVEPPATPSPGHHLDRIRQLIAGAAPAPWPLDGAKGDATIPGTGVYLRTDFWARITSGGSYGHTCFVARELAARSERLVCLLPHRYGLLDDMHVPQVVLDLPSEHQNEEDLLAANDVYYRALRVAFEVLRPSYVYERLCLGNYVAARLCQDLGIPYIIEYNGSEISMRRSFEGRGYVFESLYSAAEEAAFRQATLITTISAIVKRDLVTRGLDAHRILANPNGADVDRYAPPSAAVRRELRRELGWSDEHVVVGFTGTFGGWHGIDVLAAATPRILAGNDRIRLLLIGDGHMKPLVDRAVDEHGLADRVVRTGRVSQQEGARLMGACDLFVSPHSSHMVDSRFFGSPTKLFEYMSLGGGIVASDLEQLGDVLSPAMTLRQLVEGHEAGDARAVLCAPGDVDEFVEAVVALSRRPALAATLGKNARAAVLNYFSWQHHVDRILQAAGGRPVAELDYDPPARTAQAAADAAAAVTDASTIKPIATGDAYKDEVQKQWDHDPAGSHYVKNATPRTLEWFLEVERHRYGTYAPWMPLTMEFARHRGERVLEIGGGIGTDLAQFAANGADVTDLDLSSGHLDLARENFRLRGLKGTFQHQDAETLPFDDGTFDLVYTNGVIHHTPNTARLVDEIYRVLKPGGRVIAMVYAERSLHYWGVQVFRYGLREQRLSQWSMGEIMSQGVEISTHQARPLVKVYNRARLRALFHRFHNASIVQRQITRPELVGPLRVLPADLVGRIAGWNLVIKATRPRSTS